MDDFKYLSNSKNGISPNVNGHGPFSDCPSCKEIVESKLNSDPGYAKRVGLDTSRA